MGETMENNGRVDIPKITYDGNDKKLKERVSKFKAGTFRIAVFTVMGLFMGYYSHTYVRDTFFPTKLITAIPYKITEAIYGSILPVHTSMPLEMRGYETIGNFFPYSVVACLLAEPITTILIGGAIYGSLAYFTGDKRVFTLQRFLKFAGCWCVLILLAIGAAFGVNGKARADNERFAGEASFFFHNDRGGSYAGGADTERGELLREYFYSELEPVDVERDRAKEVSLSIYYGKGARYGWYLVNYERQYVVTEQGRTYHISREFAQVVEDYAVSSKLPEVPGAEEGEEIR